MTDVPGDYLQHAIATAAMQQVRAEERALLRALGAPIFAQLMVDRQLNPLGIEVFRSDPVDVMAFTGDTVLRIESKVGWMFTRPMPKPVV